MLTAVLDTQIILRGASSATPSITAKIYAAWDAGRFTLLLSEPILTEVEDVLGRPEVLRKLRMNPRSRRSRSSISSGGRAPW